MVRDSKRLAFCNFIRLQEKAEDNKSKQAAVEKDKKDQSKYYLSYPRPPVLDTKWENRNVNVVERQTLQSLVSQTI